MSIAIVDRGYPASLQDTIRACFTIRARLARTRGNQDGGNPAPRLASNANESRKPRSLPSCGTKRRHAAMRTD